MVLVLEILRQLQVRDRIGSNEVFEPEDMLQEMLAHDQVGAPGVRAADIIERSLKHLQEKGAGAAGEVEHRHALAIGEAIADAKALFQNVVHRAHDEIHDRWRRIVYAPGFARRRVISLQEVFVEVYKRIALEQTMLFFIACAHFSTDRFALPKR